MGLQKILIKCTADSSLWLKPYFLKILLNKKDDCFEINTWSSWNKIHQEHLKITYWVLLQPQSCFNAKLLILNHLTNVGKTMIEGALSSEMSQVWILRDLYLYAYPSIKYSVLNRFTREEFWIWKPNLWCLGRKYRISRKRTLNEQAFSVIYLRPTLFSVFSSFATEAVGLLTA